MNAVTMHSRRTSNAELAAPDTRPAAELKSALRTRLGAIRAGLSRADRAARSRRICERLMTLPWLAEAQGVALYWPLLGRGEVDVRALDLVLRNAGRAVYYPFVEPAPQGHGFGFRRVDSLATLIHRGHGFAEPDPRAVEARQGDFEVLVVPALGVAPNGHRLGHGAGFYDTVLLTHRPPARAVVVAYDVQLVQELPTESHDQPCDLVITDQHWFDPSQLLT